MCLPEAIVFLIKDFTVKATTWVNVSDMKSRSYKLILNSHTSKCSVRVSRLPKTLTLRRDADTLILQLN